MIERQVEHLSRLVDDLLDVSRITRGKVELARQVLELDAVLAKAIEMASPLLEQRSSRSSSTCRARGSRSMPIRRGSRRCSRTS